MTENNGNLISREALNQALDEQMNNFEENCRNSVFDIINNATDSNARKGFN